jgi:hypothetical protein
MPTRPDGWMPDRHGEDPMADDAAGIPEPEAPV